MRLATKYATMYIIVYYATSMGEEEYSTWVITTLATLLRQTVRSWKLLLTMVARNALYNAVFSNSV